MKRCFLLLALFAGATFLTMILGCPQAKQAADTVKAAKDMETKGEATFKTPEGDITVKQDKDSDEAVTVTTKDDKGNTVTYEGSKKLDTSKLGIEVYPGAAQQQGGTVSSSEGEITSISFETTDAFDKVSKFYTDKYPKATSQNMSTSDEGKTLMMHIQDKDVMRMIIVTEQDGKVIIALQSHSGMGK